MDTFALVKDNFRYLFFRQNRFCFVSLAHRKYSIADHLRSQRRHASHFGIDKTVQSNAIPTPTSYHFWNNLIAGGMVCILQLRKLLFCFLISVQKNANRALRRQKLFLKCILNSIFLKKEQRFLPVLKD